jgi:AraC-like DNA-binding protein
MVKASAYLRAPNASLADVAEMVGYQNESAFSKVFKRYLGVSPGGYRRHAVFQQPAQPIQ